MFTALIDGIRVRVVGSDRAWHIAIGVEPVFDPPFYGNKRLRLLPDLEGAMQEAVRLVRDRKK